MEYQFNEIERKWQEEWRKRRTYAVSENTKKPKYYVLDMFPYPSGAGLHVGHPLGYIASDIYARYMRHKGHNVLHPMGYDSFGLPAEQYAIQTGQHPAITTANNIARYRQQLDQIGFSYDWEREVRTSDPSYYKWTQWIFGLIYNSWYNNETDKAEPIENLVAKFSDNGTYGVNAACDEDWHKQIDVTRYFFGTHFSGEFTATDWNSMSQAQQQGILMHFRLAYLADSVVNWCPALGTVLANDEIKDGVSERGGHPVEQKKMTQWSMRIRAYADRLLKGLEHIEWSESIKEVQRNWIGKSEGAYVEFAVADHNQKIGVFTTRPDTIFGVSFLTLAPEHPLVLTITTAENREAIEAYMASAKLKTERDRQADVKNVTGCFTGAHVVHPLTGALVPVWIGEYVLASYGTGAVMAVPAGDQRDWDFARKFNLPIPAIFEGVDISEKAEASKDAILCASDFLNGLRYKEATQKVITVLQEKQCGYGKVNYRMRDAVFSRQRYWGEPFPIFYKDEMPYYLDPREEQVTLPDVDKYLPTEDGEPPLARASRDAWNVWRGDRMEFNTMPGWAGSSWYFLRYMDPNNTEAFASAEKLAYWNQVDLYMGGAEHGTGHLLYSRFWTKVLCDLGYITFDEPFKKMINQGMILGRSSHVYRIVGTNEFVTAERKDEFDTQQLYVDISLIENDILDLEGFKRWMPEYHDATFILNDAGKYTCTYAIDKMSKRWFNVANPDDLCEKFGADTLRMYEMFLGPVEQSKPWDTKGINGVHNFLRKLTRLTLSKEGEIAISEDEPTREELKTLHTCIKRVTEDLNRFSWNTVVSTMMICVNELTEMQSKKRSILEPLCILLAPYAPHLAEELWGRLGHNTSICDAAWPEWSPSYLETDEFEYPISINGKTKFFLTLSIAMDQEAVTAAVLANEQTQKHLDGKSPKKVIVVPKRIVNVVI
jgi:leucyl-tRNA synthetase